jgi:hypothetical protein
MICMICMIYITCMHVCMCLCMHICPYVFMHVCMYVCMYICMYVCMYVRIYVCMYVCMYVFTYVCLSVSQSVCSISKMSLSLSLSLSLSPCMYAGLFLSERCHTSYVSEVPVSPFVDMSIPCNSRSNVRNNYSRAHVNDPAHAQTKN